MMKYLSRTGVVCLALLLLESCSVLRSKRSAPSDAPEKPAAAVGGGHYINSTVPAVTIATNGVLADSIVEFAKCLVGVRYKFGSATPEQGFDCSGFISYVFNHFQIRVPRTSIAFTNAGSPVTLGASRRGDLILFTGTDTTGWKVGHMGIITQNDHGAVEFIHSASGKSVGVIISPMSDYFKKRLVKVIRVFQQ